MENLTVEVRCDGLESLDPVSQETLRATGLVCELARVMQGLGYDLHEAQRVVNSSLARAWEERR